MARISSEQVQDSNTTGNAISNAQSLTCGQCNSSFSRLAHLKRHQKTHRIEKPYQCSYCSVASSRKDVIVRHTRHFHPNSVQKYGESGAGAGAGARTRTRTQLRSPPRDASSSQSPPATASASLGLGRDGQSTQILNTNVNTHTHAHAQPPLVPEVSTSPPRTHAQQDPDFEPLLDFCGQVSNTSAHHAPASAHGSNPLADHFFNFLEPLGYADAGTWPGFIPNTLLSPGLFSEGLFDPQLGLQSSRVRPPVRGSDSTGWHPGEQNNGGYLVVDDNQYTNAKENLAHFDINQKLADFCFPSKPTLIRWLSAFFEHMAPILPVVHGPTFEIASVPSPLLIEIIACGALYTNEQGAAAELHTAALVLLKEVENNAMVVTEEGEPLFQLWQLQTSLLISYVAAFSGDGQKGHQVVETLSSTLKLAQDAIKALNASEGKTYLEWVYQETITRCIASRILLGVAQFCATNDQYFALPILDDRFPLPSNTTAWLADEANWKQPNHVMYSSDVLTQVFEGQKPSLPDSEFGFLTIVSTVLCHICLFESVIGSKHPELCTAFVSKLDPAVDALYALWQEQQTCAEFLIQSTTSPLIHLTRALLHSVTYHLHASSQLSIMKRRLVQSSFVTRAHDDSQTSCQGASRLSLDKALLCAAFAMRADCRSGLGYVKKISPHRFGPLSAMAAFEGGLLLSWYLHAKNSHPAALEPNSILDTLIEEAFLEVRCAQMRAMEPPAIVPLVTYADLLNNEVWRLLPAMSHQLEQLAGQLERMC
ncbi:hypothetical protein BKA61DRAFT_620512 [Leptodontidium sp. MPI-SDFR-AT-0119]|nr:hypothetical protein BKA61DRAFT_620512 [Leptodontidium sp. MPI-SDFR-AT-0119]